MESDAPLVTLSLDDFDFHLPEGLIAQKPAARRENSRLMVLDRARGSIRHMLFLDLPDLLDSQGVMVINDARVTPVRLHGHKESGAAVEATILNPPGSEQAPGTLELACLAKPVKRLKPGVTVLFNGGIRAEVRRVTETGRVVFAFEFDAPPLAMLEAAGRMPLPPYIRRRADDGLAALDANRYQTVYAARPGAVAAPTAGLHFSAEVLERINKKGITRESLTLLVGYGTFAPIKTADLAGHRMHSEEMYLGGPAANRIREAKEAGREIIAVGTTVVRALEYAALNGTLGPYQGPCDLFIYPGFAFNVVDRLITNFHLPRSTLLMLVSAFASRELILTAYAEAVKEKYRFFSYGDAMLIL